MSRQLSERANARLAQAPTVYAPVVPGAVVTGETGALLAAFDASLDPQGTAWLVHDPALDLAAAVDAENFSDQGLGIDNPLMHWLFWRSGSTALYASRRGGYSRAGRSTRAGTAQPIDHAFLRYWVLQAAQLVNTNARGPLGYGLARFSEGRVTSQLILFGWTPFEVASFPKSYAPGAPLTITLKPRRPMSEISFLLDRGAAIDERPITPREDGSFVVSSTAPAAPGRYFIEILDPAPARRTQLWVPIYVGVPEPVAPDAFIREPPAGPPDLGGWQAWVAAAIDAERAKLGKLPVEIDPRLTALAQERVPMFAADRRPAPAAGELSETVVRLTATDAVMLELLRPSTRQRWVFGHRVRLGVSAAPRPVKENEAPSYSLVVEAAVSPAG
jgi:hypothetical protein